MNRVYININSDIGEGIGNEKDLLPLISSCNIACGVHSGNDKTMAEVAQLAYCNGVKVGAHPSYPDRKNFGRVSLNISEDKLITSIKTQLAGLRAILEKENIPLHHIKPHGALYNDLATNTHLSRVFLRAVERYKNTASLYVPFNSCIAKEAITQGFNIHHEAFADRNYNLDLSLVSRKTRNAVIEEPQDVLEHLLCMVNEKKVQTLKGKKVPIVADTYCIHGDTPSALQILHYLSIELPKYNIHIKR
ncbi:MAG: 5-oxoprolinase subunit PxpA [Flavobacteriaceae bacterium]